MSEHSERKVPYDKPPEETVKRWREELREIQREIARLEEQRRQLENKISGHTPYYGETGGGSGMKH